MLNKTLKEDGNGGQPVLQGNEIQQTESLATLAYLAMFTGNVLADTEKENKTGELKIDWWGNDPALNSKTWINSKTERVLRGIEISSSSRFTIQAAVESDVKELEKYGKVSVEVAFPAINRISIIVSIREPAATQDSSLLLVWDASRNEIIQKNII